MIHEDTAAVLAKVTRVGCWGADSWRTTAPDRDNPPSVETPSAAGRRRYVITSVLVVALAAGLALLPVRLGASVRNPDAPTAPEASAGLPAGLAQAIHHRFGPVPIRTTAPGSVEADQTSGAGSSEQRAALSFQVDRFGGVTARSGLKSAALVPASLSASRHTVLLRPADTSRQAGRFVQTLGPLIASEWTTADGFEQTFTISRAPVAGAQQVRLDLRSSSRWLVTSDGSALVGPYGIRYQSLRTTDATGRVIPSHFVVTSAGATIVIDTKGSSYPLTVDPTWASTGAPGATLTAGGAPPGSLGVAVSLSADGTTALAGAPFASNFTGAAYIFHATSPTAWSSTSIPTATLPVGTLVADDQFGLAVALSADGTTALVGAQGVASNSGAAYVFHVSTEASWPSVSGPVATLTSTSNSLDALFGSATALSADGTVALIGASGTASGTGATYIFRTSSASSWVSSSNPTATLGAVGHPNATFGNSVSLSSDGTTALVGASFDQSGVGAAFVFHVPSANAWADSTTPTATLTRTGGTNADDFGDAVALSADGTTGLVGTLDTGAAYLFRSPSEGSWTNSGSPTATLTNGGGASDFDFGLGVALSADGTTAMVGDDAVPVTANSADFRGAAYVFQVPTPTAWGGAQPPVATLTNASGHPDDGLGSAVGLSADGQSSFIGANGAAGGRGAAYVFARGTATVASASPAHSSFGQSVTFNAQVTGSGSAPTGTVSFTTGTTSLCTGTLSNGVASCTAFTSPVGTDQVTASYGGDANFDPSTAVTQIVVGPAATRAGSSVAATSDHLGYWLSEPGGGVAGFGDATLFGSMAGQALNQPIVGIAGGPGSQGYWLVAADGGIFAFGDAGFFGSTGGQALNQPIVGMTATPDGHGYWLEAADGGVFAFGDAGFFGSMGGQPLNQPIVDGSATPDGRGYWLVAADGGVFAFGDAGFFGSMGGQTLNQPIVGIDGTADGNGYWLVAVDGGVFAFGDAGFFGSTGGTPSALATIGLLPTATFHGYQLVDADGGSRAFGS